MHVCQWQEKLQAKCIVEALGAVLCAGSSNPSATSKNADISEMAAAGKFFSKDHLQCRYTAFKPATQQLYKKWDYRKEVKRIPTDTLETCFLPIA